MAVLGRGEGEFERLRFHWHGSHGHNRAVLQIHAAEKDKEPWLGWPIIRFTWKRLLKASCLRFINETLSFARPLLMQQILYVVEGSPAIVEADNAWMLGAAMVFCSFLQLLLGVHYDNTINRMAFRL